MENEELLAILNQQPEPDVFNQELPVLLREAPIYCPTKFTILTGSDGVLDDLFSYQVFNYLKNHWRAAAAPADKQPGMIRSDSDDDKLHHYGNVGGAAWEEILQLTRSNDVSPQFATVRFMDTGADHYLDVKCNENLTANKLLYFIVGDVNRVVTLSGNPTLGNWFDQSVKQAAGPTFASLEVTGKVTIGAVIGTASQKLDVRGDSSGAWVASFEQDHATGWGVLIEVDSEDAGDPAFQVSNPSTRILNVSSAGNLKLDIGNIIMDSATSSIDGGAALNLEAGATGIFSDTIYNDTAGVSSPVHIDGTHQLYRQTSARKYKEKIVDLKLDSSLIYNFRPVSYISKCKIDKGKEYIGFVAEEVESYYPEIIIYNKDGGVENYDSQMLMTLMLAEMQRHEARIKELEAQLNN